MSISHHLRFLALAALLAFVLPTSLYGQAPTRSETKPNIVLIVVDDLGYGEPGCYGGTEIPTPNIDNLALTGARFTNGYVTASYCAASRAALLTGRYQTRFGFEFNPIGAANCKPGIGLPTTERTIADSFRDAGYATALIGKWHLGGTAEFHPQRRGFDEFFGFLHEGHFFVPPPYFGTTTWLRRKSLPGGNTGRWTSSDGKIIWSTHMGHNEPPYDTDNPILRSSQPVSEPANLTTAFTREASDFISRHHTQPFFLYLAYNAVHSPLQADDGYLEKFSHIQDIQRRIFAAMLSHLDDGIGQVVDTLQQHDLTDNTLIFLLSDNGGPTKELTSSNAPLRGGKGNVYEGGIRVPMIATWPGKITPAVISTPVIATDIAATIDDLISPSIDQPTPNRQQDGQSWLPLFENSNFSDDRPLFWRMGANQAIRQNQWKTVRHQSRNWELYDLSTDISEANNLASQYPDQLKQLIEQWEAWNAQQAEPLWR